MRRLALTVLLLTLGTLCFARGGGGGAHGAGGFRGGSGAGGFRVGPYGGFRGGYGGYRGYGFGYRGYGYRGYGFGREYPFWVTPGDMGGIPGSTMAIPMGYGPYVAGYPCFGGYTYPYGCYPYCGTYVIYGNHRYLADGQWHRFGR